MTHNILDSRFNSFHLLLLMFRNRRRRVLVRSISLIGGLLVRNSTCPAVMALASSSSSSASSSSDAAPPPQQPPTTHAGASPHWEALWAGGLAKGSRFDVAGVSRPLAAELARRRNQNEGVAGAAASASGGRTTRRSALIPGAGRAYDAIALAEHGFDSVTAVDLSPTACNAARKEIATYNTAAEQGNAINVLCADFFDLTGHYDFIWDNTFLCALDPSARERWALKMKALLTPNTGELITCVFPIGEREGGPPFALSIPLVTSLLEPVGFQATLVQDQLPLEHQHRRPGDPLESVLTRGSALVTWRLCNDDDNDNNNNNNNKNN